MIIFKKIITAWIDCVFPPLCEVCKEPCSTRLLCASCWEFCAPLDPKGRCRHCFGELDEAIICQQCREDPLLPIPSAFVFERSRPVLRLYRERKERPETIAAFALFQWERLVWPIPDAIVPLPGVFEIANAFAQWIERPCIRVFKQGNADLMLLEEDSILLLISETDFPLQLQESIDILSGAFPKKIYSLSLLHDDFVIHSNPGAVGRASVLGNAHCSSTTSMDCSASW